MTRNSDRKYDVPPEAIEKFDFVKARPTDTADAAAVPNFLFLSAARSALDWCFRVGRTESRVVPPGVFNVPRLVVGAVDCEVARVQG